MNSARSRFVAALAVAITGAVLGVGAFTLSPSSERWLALGVGAAVLVTLAAAFAVRGRGRVQRILDGPLALVCAWTIVCARVIESSGAGSSAHAVKWFNLAAGAAIASFGLVGLLVHERGMERGLLSEVERAVELEASARLALSVTGELDAFHGGADDHAHEADRVANGRSGNALSRTPR
jgi:hypothetical protein